VAGRATGEPFFPSPIILDEDLGRRFLRLHASLDECCEDLRPKAP
jgi:hypothetical protein